MNQSAERHLAKAETYLGKGEEFYRKAGEEILLAREEGATWAEIEARLDRSKSWCQKVSEWAKIPASAGSSSLLPYSGEAPAINLRKTKQLLREAPIEQIEHIISGLPAERQRQIGAAAGEAYTTAVNRVADNTRRPVTEDVGGMFVPRIGPEKRALIAKLAEVKAYLARHGDTMIPDPDGGNEESLRDLALGGIRADKGEIDHAFAELGIGTSIEEGFDRLLSES